MAGSNRIRVLIVDDSAFMRKFFEDLLSSASDIEVIGRARNGMESISKIRSLKPDVVTMDVEMPVMDGLSALEIIMKENPLPVIMVSTLTSRGAEITLKCLERGALDFVQKPSSRDLSQMQKIGSDLLMKVRLAVSSKHVQFSAEEEACAEHSPVIKPLDRGPFQILLVASSTGGPQALSRLLPEFPEDFPVPVALVQHMPKAFTSSFAKRLDQLSRIKVVEAEEGMSLCPGKAVLAPGGSHLLLKGSRQGLFCSLSDTPPVNSVRPAADCLFGSVALLPDIKTVTAILTGMGRDGTAGARSLRAGGSVILAESAETAVVYGMPKSARDAGLVDFSLPLHRMAGEIMRYFRKP